LEGRGSGEMRVTEHLSEKIFPAMLCPEGERIIGPKCTIGNNKIIKVAILSFKVIPIFA
jgi:hypothetical protein